MHSNALSKPLHLASTDTSDRVDGATFSAPVDRTEICSHRRRAVPARLQCPHLLCRAGCRSSAAAWRHESLLLADSVRAAFAVLVPARGVGCLWHVCARPRSSLTAERVVSAPPPPTTLHLGRTTAWACHVLSCRGLFHRTRAPRRQAAGGCGAVLWLGAHQCSPGRPTPRRASPGAAAPGDATPILWRSSRVHACDFSY
jgi:hypothetical protein